MTNRLSVCVSRRAPAGQALIETLIVVPVVLLMALGMIQVALIGWAGVRLQVAAASAARSFVVFGDPERARQAAAMVMAAVSPAAAAALRDAGGDLRAVSALKPAVGGPWLEGLNRYLYAYGHTWLVACHRPGPDRFRGVVRTDDGVRLQVKFALPLLIPFVAGLFAEATPANPPQRRGPKSTAQTTVDAAAGAVAMAMGRVPRTMLAHTTAVTWPHPGRSLAIADCA